MNALVSSAPLLGGLGLLFAGFLYWSVVRSAAGTERMQEIAEAIHSGAMAFLRREYSILFVFVAVVGAAHELGKVRVQPSGLSQLFLRRSKPRGEIHHRGDVSR